MTTRGTRSADRTVDLGWGTAPLRVALPDGAWVAEALTERVERDWWVAVEAALAAPVGSSALADRARGGRVAVVVPDRTRKGVAEEILPVLAPHLEGAARVEVWIGSGKHPPERRPAYAHHVHDAHADDLVPVGRTAHGTEVAYPPGILAADLRVVVGEVRPHYFAGWSGGAKGLFPGVAGAAGIWHNHELKAVEGARLGVVDGNPCRADFEAAAAMAGPAFLVNVVRGPGGRPIGAFAGDLVDAHRAAADCAREVFGVDVASRADVVLVSDRHPVTSNLYQACKLLPPAGAVLKNGGTIVLAADLAEGVGPVDIINEKIFRLGVIHALPRDHRILLASTRPPEAIAPTFATWVPTVEAALDALDPGADLIVMPRAGDVVPRLAAV